jgi:5'-nucleotidase / UDP-sugar diphosphatase
MIRGRILTWNVVGSFRAVADCSTSNGSCVVARAIEDTPFPEHGRTGFRRSIAGAARSGLVAVLAGLWLAGCVGDPPAGPPAGAGADELHFTILHTSDEHSNLLPAPLVEYRPDGPDAARGGFARLAGVVEEVRARKTAVGEPVLLTSAGDFLSGTPFAWLLLDGEAPELTLMTELGYDVITLGNHEFDYGPERLAGYLRAAGQGGGLESPGPAGGRGSTAVVATNTRPPDGHPLAEAGIRHTHLVTLENGLRVGFLGLIGRGAARVAPGAEPVTFADPNEAAAEAEQALRAAGAQLVVAVTHSGLVEDRSLARAVPGIDLILGGHDHRLLPGPVAEGRTLIVHPGQYLEQVVHLELAFDPASGRLRVRNDEAGVPLLVPLDADVPESPWMAARVADYRLLLEQRLADLTGGEVTDLAQTVAHSTFSLNPDPRTAESTLGNFITDAIHRAAEEATGMPVDVALQASGQIRSRVVPGTAGWNVGRVSAYDLLTSTALGYGPEGTPGYPLVSVWLTGDEVRRAMEVSVLLTELMGSSYFLQVAGLEVTYDPRRAVLVRIPVRGTPVPSGRAVLSAHHVAGNARTALVRGDTTLYHVVTERYVASFLPLVGRLVPRLNVVPKTREGTPIDDLDEAIVYIDGREAKVWHAVLRHTAAQPAGEGGGPWIADTYEAPEGRLQQVRTAPLWLWPVIGLVLIIAILAAFIIMRRRRRRPLAAG